MKTSRIALSAILAAAPASEAFAAESRTFNNVTPAVFDCVKRTSEAQQGTVYVETEANRGTATTSSTLWTVVMDYVFTPDTGDLEYELVRKTWIVPADTIWSGIADTIAGCRPA